jgi:TPR repeat protein
MILAQLVFLYAFDALLSWSRGRSWRLGCGPLPIILSTNVFIWFKDDWFVYQFLLVAVGALGKEFIKWQREGRKTHIFNPSAFTLSLFSVVLIATDTTSTTWGVEIATTIFRPPHIYLEIFLLGLVVQYFFSVTLMTLAAASTLCLLNLAYTANTGVYHFVDTNIPAAVFLGFHLLVTDPSTSPRTRTGRVIFGALYGVSIWVLYSILGSIGAPQFYDKLLPIPLLNLSVQLIDRLAVSGTLGRLTRWEATFSPRKTNLVYMSCWSTVFATMLATGFVEAPHQGQSIAFWKQAANEGKPRAGEKLLTMLNTRITKGSGVAAEALGGLIMEGKLVRRDPATAAHYFALACEQGSTRGCASVATLYLFEDVAASDEAVQRAFDHLEERGSEPVEPDDAFLLGMAFEIGKGRPRDAKRSYEAYRAACEAGSARGCQGVVRSTLSTLENLSGASQTLEASCAAGDAESCVYLAYLIDRLDGYTQTDPRIQPLLERACELGSTKACERLKALR